MTPELSFTPANGGRFDEHWELMSELCHPCLIKYDVIGKYETFFDDSTLVLHMIGADNFTFPKVNETAGTSAKLQHYLDQIPPDSIEKLYKLYENDFILFDYNIDEGSHYFKFKYVVLIAFFVFFIFRTGIRKIRYNLRCFFSKK